MDWNVVSTEAEDGVVTEGGKYGGLPTENVVVVFSVDGIGDCVDEVSAFLERKDRQCQHS